MLQIWVSLEMQRRRNRLLDKHSTSLAWVSRRWTNLLYRHGVRLWTRKESWQKGLQQTLVNFRAKWAKISEWIILVTSESVSQRIIKTKIQINKPQAVQFWHKATPWVEWTRKCHFFRWPARSTTTRKGRSLARPPTHRVIRFRKPTSQGCLIPQPHTMQPT